MTHMRRLFEFTALKDDMPNENAGRYIRFQKRKQMFGGKYSQGSFKLELSPELWKDQ